MPKKHPMRLEHRSLLNHPPGFRPFRGTDLFERIGGQPTIDRLVDLLYEGINDDDQLRPLFPRDVADRRSMQKLFFAEWLGGPRRYSEQAHAGVRHGHDGLPITPALAGRWLGHFRRALEATVVASSDRRAIFAQVRSLAMALVSGQVAPARLPGRGNGPGRKNVRGSESENDPRPVAWCGIGARSVARARDLAHRGDVAGLSAVLAEAPDLLLPSYAAAIMQAAALAGRAEIVWMLLDGGAGADHPFYLPVSVTGVAFERVVFVTPLCAARMKHRWVVESLLLAAEAKEDIFTSAFLGDLTSLAGMLRPILALLRRRIPRSTSSTSHPSNTRSRAGRPQRCDSSWTTSRIRHRAMCGPCAVPLHRAAWRWSSCCWRTGRTRDGSASDAGSFIPSLLRCLPATARRSTPRARGSVPAAREIRVARTILSMSAPSCATVPA
jgi:truncated hemoglobin YjbI